MKNINTLVKDIESIVESQAASNDACTNFMRKTENTFIERFTSTTRDVEESEVSKPSQRLRMSSLGTPCKRKLWYRCNLPSKGESLNYSARLKFSYGDFLENLLITLARDSGHDVILEQHEVNIVSNEDVKYNITGHIDCVIDGMLIDVKSASNFGFRKFKFHQLEHSDDFGYLSQLSSYLYALQGNPAVTYKDKAGFLAIDKSSGEIALDIYDLSRHLKEKETKLKNAVKLVDSPKVPERSFKDKKKGESGNRVLGTECTYCSYKHTCWSSLRVFGYNEKGNVKNVYFTKVVKEPNVPEIF